MSWAGECVVRNAADRPRSQSRSHFVMSWNASYSALILLANL
ncbi:MAG: hypothetical protein N2Z63_11260 [Thiobacillaceae bacterium]|nr:hypothetical protein [Myxococcota bacterium]MCX7674151.1 hypothetical protein [Thiobacillaceae bacterium]